MVDHSPTRLHFHDESTNSMVRVGVERLLDRAAPPEKDRNANLLILVLAGFNLETDFLETFAYRLKDFGNEVEALFAFAMIASKHSMEQSIPGFDGSPIKHPRTVALRAAGDSIAGLARDFRLEISAIEEAIRCEAGLTRLYSLSTVRWVSQSEPNSSMRASLWRFTTIISFAMRRIASGSRRWESADGLFSRRARG